MIEAFAFWILVGQEACGLDRKQFSLHLRLVIHVTSLNHVWSGFLFAFHSHYFRAMFYSNFREADQKEIHLRDMDAAALKSLLEYTYKGSTEIGPDNVESLLAVACNLQFTQVQKECCDYLEKQLDPCNCIGIAKLANLHACHQLAEKARSFACRQFLLLTNEEEILNLTATEMVPLLSYDDLTVDAEEDVLKVCTILRTGMNRPMENTQPNINHLSRAQSCSSELIGFLMVTRKCGQVLLAYLRHKRTHTITYAEQT